MHSNDPYFDSEIGDLKNLLGARSSAELHEREPQVVLANELELASLDLPITSDLSELLAIHAQLFKGVYEWAGKIRTVQIKKPGDDSDFFLIAEKILDACHFVFTELKDENYLVGLERHQFANRLSYYYDQLNFIHPFREGNGRAQRLFWTRVANRAGYIIPWDEIHEGENNEASRVATKDTDRSLLEAMFSRVIRLMEE